MRQIISTAAASLSPIRKLPPAVVGLPHDALVTITPGLVLWLDAETSVKWQTTAGGTLAEASSDPVGTWVDRVTGRTAVQGTAGSRPLYIPAAYNGKAALRFDGTNDQLVVTGTSAEEVSDITLFVVAKATSATSRVLLAKAHAASGWAFPYQRWGFYANTADYLTVWNGNNTEAGSWSTGDLKVLELVDADGYANGTKVTDGTDAALSYPNANTPIYVSGNGISSECWSGDICEVVIYGRALTTTERSALRASLGVKWGISVA